MFNIKNIASGYLIIVLETLLRREMLVNQVWNGRLEQKEVDIITKLLRKELVDAFVELLLILRIVAKELSK
jgi:hypothetical protein